MKQNTLVQVSIHSKTHTGETLYFQSWAECKAGDYTFVVAIFTKVPVHIHTNVQELEFIALDEAYIRIRRNTF